MEPWMTELGKNGGFALLAGLAMWICFKMGNLRAQDLQAVGSLRAEDLKIALERERESRKSTEELHRATLATLTSLCGEISGLKTAVTGLLEDARTGRLEDTWTGRRRKPAEG